MIFFTLFFQNRLSGCIFCACFFLFYFQAIGQTTQQENPLPVVIPPAPDAASLGKYGEFPVSESSGLPSISIPLFEVKSGSLSLPVALSYHAGGVRVADNASWVGLNFSLQAGGVISRTMRGLPDEESQIGYLDYWNVVKDLDNSGNGADDYFKLEALATGNADAQPDVFHYNFSGASGKFIYDGVTGIPQTIPYAPVKIEHTSVRKFAGYRRDFAAAIGCSPGPNIDYLRDISEKSLFTLYCTHTYPDDSVFYMSSGYRITASNGVIYEFDNTEETFVNVRGADQEYISSWYLSRIVSADHFDTISFEYKQNPGTLTYGVDYSESILKDVESFSTPSPTCSFSLAYVRQPQVLKRIVFRGGELLFSSSSSRSDLPGAYRLESIILNSIQGNSGYKEFVRQVDFSYGYFNSHSVNDTSSPCGMGIQPQDYLRLKLMSLQESSGTDSRPPYEFIYSTRMLPHRLSRAQDHWGFYNGVTNETLIPKVSYSDFTVGKANRKSNEAAMLACSLQEIVYPTGGKTVFNMEAHKITSMSAPTYTWDVPTVFKLYGVNSEQASHVSQSWNWPQPFPVPDTITLADVTWNSEADVIVEFGTIPYTDNSGPYPYIKTPSLEIIRNNGSSLVSRILYDDSDPHELDPYTGVFVSVSRTTIPIIDFANGAYTIRLLTSTDERNYIKATIIRRGTYNGVPVQTTQVYGGLRLQEVITKQPDETVSLRKRFDYSDAYLATGLSYKVHYEKAGIYYRVYDQVKSTGGAYTETNRYLSIGGQPLAAAGGSSAVSYGTVTQTALGKDQTNGKIVSYFSKYTDQVVNAYPYAPAVSQEWRRGWLLNSDTYDAAGYLVQSIVNHYTLKPQSTVHGMKTGYSESHVNGGMYQEYDLTDFSMERFSEASVWYYIDSTRVTNFTAGGSQNQYTRLYYNNPAHGQVCRKVVWGDEQERLIQEYTYPHDYSIVQTGEDAIMSDVSIPDLISRYIIDQVIESRTLLVKGDTTVIGGKVLAYNNIGKVKRSYRLETDQPVPIASFQRSERADDFDSRYTVDVSMGYDVLGRLNHVEKNGFVKAYLWDDASPVAEASNAVAGQLYYNSFEHPWESSGISVSGRYSHTGSFTIVKPDIAGEYILSYWSRTAGSPWVLRQEALHTSTRTIGGSGIYIDEVRIFPKGTQMTTYTYSPLVGTSTVTSPNNQSQHFTYDGLGRLSVVKDDKGQILKTIEYNYTNN